MILFATRHGQVIPSEFTGDELYQAADRPLTELGHVQAGMLGRELERLGFRGTVYSSPFRRTMQTAEHIADITGSVIVPVYWLHEKITNDETARTFIGMTKEQLCGRFRHVGPDFEIACPWFAGRAETPENVDVRIKDGMDSLLASVNEDCLLVCHGASFAGVRRYLGLECPDRARTWNCSLTRYAIGKGKAEILQYADISFMPREITTDNGKTYDEIMNPAK